MSKFILSGFFCLIFSVLLSQKLWTESDRQYLLDNLNRTSLTLEKEISGLTDAQWHFKESPDRWSIAQVIEHLGIYESLYNKESAVIVQSKPEPALNSSTKNDSVYLAWMAETQPHTAGGLGLPLGLIPGADNWIYFKTLRDQNIVFIANTPADLRAYFTYRPNDERWSIHQLYIILFAHCDRHLKQVLKIKANPDFPKG